MAQSAQIPAEIAGAKSLKTKVPAPVSAKGKWAELGEKELKDVLSAEKNDALRFLAIVKQCDDAEDWEMAQPCPSNLMSLMVLFSTST